MIKLLVYLAVFSIPILLELNCPSNYVGSEISCRYDIFGISSMVYKIFALFLAFSIFTFGIPIFVVILLTVAIANAFARSRYNINGILDVEGKFKEYIKIFNATLSTTIILFLLKFLLMYIFPDFAHKLFYPFVSHETVIY